MRHFRSEVVEVGMRLTPVAFKAATLMERCGSFYDESIWDILFSGHFMKDLKA